MKTQNVLLRYRGFGSGAFQNLTAALFLLALGIFQAQGQSMLVHEKNDIEKTYSLKSLKSLVFTKVDMTIEQYGQIPMVVVKDNVRYFSFSNLTSTVHAPKHLKGEVRLFPNPVRNELHVEWTQNESFLGRIEVISMNGTVVHVELIDRLRSSCEVDVSRLAPGIYFCKVHLDNGVKTIKFQKL